MPYPWPSFGGFLFRFDEKPVWGTDAGWARAPSYSRQRPLGTSTDSIVALAIGSAERNFEMYLTPDRFAQLEQLLSSKAVFTDWASPPDSRTAFLTELTPVEDAISNSNRVSFQRKRRTRISLVSA